MAGRYRKGDAVTLAPRGRDLHPHETHSYKNLVLSSLTPHPVSISAPDRENESHYLDTFIYQTAMPRYEKKSYL